MEVCQNQPHIFSTKIIHAGNDYFIKHSMSPMMIMQYKE